MGEQKIARNPQAEVCDQFHAAAAQETSPSASAVLRLGNTGDAFRSFFWNHPQAMLLADRECNLARFNRALLELLGYSCTRQPGSRAARRLVSLRLGLDDAQLWKMLLANRVVPGHAVSATRRDGTRTVLVVTGLLLERRRNGNHLAGWTFVQGTSGDDPAAGVQRSDKDPSARSAGMHLYSDLSGSDAHQGDPSTSCTVVEQNTDAMSLVIQLMNDRTRELEGRISENITWTIVPLLEHLKAGGLSASQAVLLENLEFNLGHIMSGFGICVARTSKPLSSRELEICRMIRAGKKSREIAEALGLKYQTVMVHRKHIRKKLDLKIGASQLSVVLRDFAEPEVRA